MLRKRRKSRSIVLPWEQQGGVRRPILSRIRPVLAVIAVLLVFLFIAQRERTQAGIRSTRASLLILRRGIDAYRANHEGKCPSDLDEVQKKGYLQQIPTDAWGRPFVLTCPGRIDGEGYDLESPGPDGIPGGLDRIE